MCVSARPEINACKRSYLDRNGLGGAVVGHWYPIFWRRQPSQNITPTRALLAPINIISPRRAGASACSEARPDARHSGTLDYLEEYVWPNCSRTPV